MLGKTSDKRERQYDIEANVPVINIKSDVIASVNKEIDALYNTKIKSIKAKTEVNTVYTVDYAANVQGNILSVMIKATLQEGTSPKRTTIQTYNYNIVEDRLFTLEEAIVSTIYNPTSVQVRINKEIDSIISQNKARQAEGYEIYERDSKSDIYKIENSRNFFISKDGYVYIIYAYGNTERTTEMDLVII